MALYQSITRSARRFDVDWVTAILDLPVYRMFELLLHNPFTGFDGTHPLPYLGSAASLPVWMRISEWEQHLVHSDRDLHDLVFNGVGLAAAVRALAPLDHHRLVAWNDDLSQLASDAVRSAASLAKAGS
jgi:hypothetical protein